MLSGPPLHRLGAAALACLGSLTTPSCTLMLWGDDRSVESLAIAPAAELRGWRLPDEPTAFVVQMSAATAHTLRAHVPELPAAVEWLEVRPRTQDAGSELAIASRDPRWPVNLAAFRDPPEAAAVWAFSPHTGPLKGPPFGFTSYTGFYRDAACDVAVLPGPPAARGQPIAVEISYATPVEDGTTVPVRIALTPLFLAGDVAVGACFVVAAAGWIVLLPIAWPIHELTKSDEDHG